jgi:cytoskeleton protein RodZ
LVASLEGRRDRLELRVTSPSWVGVYDAHGKLLFNQVLRPGSVSVVQGGALPLRLRIGNARATELKFRGRVVDLAPSTKDNVARLHLN